MTRFLDSQKLGERCGNGISMKRQKESVGKGRKKKT